MKNTFTTTFNRKLNTIRDVSTVKFTSPSKVKKSLSYAVDINTIYDNYCRTGKLPLNGQQPLYDENFIAYNDLIEAQKLCDEASKYFQGLPATIKNQYGNDLRKFILALNQKDDFLVKNGVLNLPKKSFDASSSAVEIKSDVKPADEITPVKPPVEKMNTATDGLSE